MTRRTSLPLLLLLLGLGWMMLVPARSGQAQAPVPDSVVLEPDITFATVAGVPLKLDLARPKTGEGPWPLIVCIHGGGWQAGSRADFREAILALAAQGFAAASVQYRLAPTHRFPAQFEDVRAAVAYLRANAKERRIDPDRVAAVGGSAGGHLALMLATDPAVKLRAAVSLAGPTDLTRPLPDQAVGIVREFVGPDNPNAAEARRQASPIFRVGPATPPTFLIHGDHDELVPYDQATAFRDACTQAGRDVTLVTIKDGRHGGGGKPADHAAALAQAVRFLQDQTRPRP